MHGHSARHASYFAGAGAGQHLGNFKPEIPQPTEWDQLLAKLSLSDLQALEAVRSDGERGEQLRKFVSRFFGHYFVPEEVILAVRDRKKKTPAISLASQPTTINSNAAATTSGELV